MSQKKQILMVCLLLAMATFAVFWQVRQYDFVNLDDPVYVTANRHIQGGLSPEGVRWAFTTAHASFWHPLTWLSLMLDSDLYGLKPGGYHLTSLILHVLNTLLLFWLFHRMTGALWRSAFVAALFALHPLHVESVAWVSQRKDTLSTFFWMLTLCAYVVYTQKPAARRYMLALACFTLGMMAKPMLVTLPFVLLLLDYWPLNRFHGRDVGLNPPAAAQPVPSQGRGRKRREAMSKKKASQKVIPPPKAPVLARAASPGAVAWRLVMEKIPFFVLSAVFSAVAYYAQHQVSYITFPPGSRIANALVAYVVYLQKTFWPVNLAVFYPFPEALPGWQMLGAALIMALISVVVVAAARRWPFLPVGWFWYVGILVPVIGIVQVGTHALADRYTYIPLIGLFVMAAWGVPELLKKWRYGKAALIAATTLILAGLTAVTWTQTGHWRNSITLFEHALKVTDRNDLAHNNLGIALRGAGKVAEAESHYREALRIRPDSEQAHFNLGNLLFAGGRADDAISHYQAALRIRPGYENAHVNLGAALMSRGLYGQAVVHYRKAISLGNADAGVYYSLGAALAATGQMGEATVQLRQAILASPAFAEAHNELGRVLAMQGKTQEGIVHFREALRLKPGYAAADHNLRLALENLGRKR